MNLELLKQLVKDYAHELQTNPIQFESDKNERKAMVDFYSNCTEKKIMAMNTNDIFDYLHGLWAMMMWGNKNYVVNKIIENTGLENFRLQLANFVWGKTPIGTRWDQFRAKVKGMGPAMMSEILCKSKPNDYVIWNRSQINGLSYLGVKNLPKYDYQLNGAFYESLCDICKQIGKELKTAGIADLDLLGVDYFLWKVVGSKVHAPGVPEQIQPEITVPIPPQLVRRSSSTTKLGANCEISESG